MESDPIDFRVPETPEVGLYDGSACFVGAALDASAAIESVERAATEAMNVRRKIMKTSCFENLTWTYLYQFLQ
jgi:hypothetical protein